VTTGIPEEVYADYPPHWEADVVVSDGGTMHIRPITPDNADAMLGLHSRLSERSRYYRYFSTYQTVPERDLQRFSHVDHHDRVALGAWLGNDLVAIGRFDRLSEDPTKAEVAFVVEDDHQGRGIGSVLLEHLADAGREVGIERFSAYVLAENRQMLRVFRDAGYDTESEADGSEISLEFDIARSDAVDVIRSDREQRAEARSIQRLLFPRSVAVIGASDDSMKLGKLLMNNLTSGGFRGTIHPVNRAAAKVGGLPAYPSINDVPGEIDLAILAIPAISVLGVIEECHEKGVRGLIVVSGGFGEAGGEKARADGLLAQRELVLQARAHGMRVIGPNSLGLINTDSSVSMNASVAPYEMTRGRAGVFCQSAALGVAVLGESGRRGIGISTFVSAGNRADVSGNDLLQYWEADPDTEIALLYLESFGNPRKFGRLARRFARRKPIVAVKGGRASVVPGLAHTTVKVPEASVQALFEASGVIRTQSLAELFDVALLLITQPLPQSDSVAVLGHSSALGLLVEDALTMAGLPIARFVDVGYNATEEMFADALRAVLEADDVGAVIALFVPPIQPGLQGEGLARQLHEISKEYRKPVVAVLIGFSRPPEQPEVAGASHPARGTIPVFQSPEQAVTALAQVAKYARWRRRPRGNVPYLTGIDHEAARAFVDGVLGVEPDGRALTPGEVTRLLGWFGIRVSLDEPGDGVETIFELRDDRSFGTLLSFGVGGLATELLNDRAYAVVPITQDDAIALINGPKAFPLLSGYGWNEPADLHSLVDLALRLSHLADDLPEVAECVLAPVLAATSGTQVHGATLRLLPPVVPADLATRRMPEA